MDAFEEVLVSVAIPAREHTRVELAPSFVILFRVQLVGLLDIERRWTAALSLIKDESLVVR